MFILGAINGNEIVIFSSDFCYHFVCPRRELSGISGLVGTQWCKWRVLETRVMVSGGRCESERTRLTILSSHYP